MTENGSQNGSTSVLRIRIHFFISSQLNKPSRGELQTFISGLKSGHCDTPYYSPCAHKTGACVLGEISDYVTIVEKDFMTLVSESRL